MCRGEGLGASNLEPTAEEGLRVTWRGAWVKRRQEGIFPYRMGKEKVVARGKRGVPGK